MKVNQYDYVLSMFIPDVEYRTGRNNIFPNENYYCATDSFTLCVVPQELVGGEYEKIEKTPDVSGVLNKHSFNQEKKISKEFLLENLSSVEWIYRRHYKYCQECEGTGVEICECCGHQTDCEDCEGEGLSNDVIPFSKMALAGEDVLFLGKRVIPNYLNKVLLSAYILEAEDIICKWNDTISSPILFEIKDCKILIMSKL